MSLPPSPPARTFETDLPDFRPAPPLPASPHAPRLELALSLARHAGQVAMRLYQSPALTPIQKPDGSVVTSADKDSEQLIRAGVAASFAHDAILGEEFGDTPSLDSARSSYRWIIDPIDGTSSFVKGVPTFACLIGIEHAGQVVAGVAHFPALGETLWAIRGAGARWRCATGEVVVPRAAEAPDLSQASIQTASAPAFARHGYSDAFSRLASSVRRTHGWNDAFSFALAATGRFAGVVGFGFSKWDVAPFEAIFAEVGAEFTDWDGKSPPQHTAVAAHPALHAKLRTILRGA